jgi:hypothetical protein
MTSGGNHKHVEHVRQIQLGYMDRHEYSCRSYTKDVRRGERRYRDFPWRYSALRQWLHSHLGERWNDVWSEVCKVAPANHYRGIELRRRVSYMVDIFGPRYMHYVRHDQLYVDLDTGLLCIYKHKPKHKAVSPPIKFDITPLLRAEKAESGIWYLYHYEMRQSQTYLWNPTLGKCDIREGPLVPTLVRTSQLSTAQLQQYGLHNDVRMRVNLNSGHIYTAV